MTDDYYKKHITSLDESHGLVSTQAIYNEQGQKLVPEKEKLTSKTIEKIIKFKLLKPVQELVSIENEINANQLNKLFIRYMRESIDLSDIYENSEFKHELKSFCEFALKSPIVRQKLTVMHEKLYSTFEQTIFTAWFSAHIYMRLNKPHHDIQQAFLAALLRDFGLMHIDPVILSTQNNLDEKQWKQLTSHPIISSKIAQSITYTDDICVDAIAQHHESSEGAGFPKGKKSDQLNSLSQVLNMLDGTYAVYKKSYLPNQRHISDVIPVLQINTRPKISREFKSLLSILKVTPVTEHTVITPDKTHDVIDEIEQAYHYINNHMKVTLKILGVIMESAKNAELTAIKQKYIQVQNTVTQSGLINEAYLRWLMQVKSKKIASALREAEDAYMMMREVTYHLDRLDTLLKVYLGKYSHQDTQDDIQNLTMQYLDKTKPIFIKL